MINARKFDAVIFGASGFTGKFVVEELAEQLRDKKIEHFRWAVAGRSKDKLSQVLAQVTSQTGYDVTNVEMLEADIDSSSSIRDMAKSCKVIMNCVGPYRFYGEAVVKACIAEGTHHLDISGEPQFLEKMELLHHTEAEAKGVYVVGACGWDCIPTDMGISYLKSKFNGDLNSVEMYLEFDGQKAQKSVLNYGSWLSAINIFGFMSELDTIRAKLFRNPLPKPKYELRSRSLIHCNDIVGGWCLPFIGTDKSVVERSQRFFFEKYGQRPVQINTYFKQESLFVSMVCVFGFICFWGIVQFKLGRYLLEKYPGLFTFGYISNKGPTRQEMDLPFTFTLVGEGWSEEFVADYAETEHKEKPNKTIVVKVRGRNPGYGATCHCLIQSALTILREKSKMPSIGGVYTTAAAFSKTTLVERLNNVGVTFEISGN